VNEITVDIQFEEKLSGINLELSFEEARALVLVLASIGGSVEPRKQMNNILDQLIEIKGLNWNQSFSNCISGSLYFKKDDISEAFDG